MLFSSNRDPRIYFLPPISYVFVLHHTHIVVVSLNCLFFTHKYTARFTNMNEGGFGTRAGAARHTKRLFCFYFPEGIYIYLYKVTIHPVSWVKKKERYKTEKMQLYVPSLHVLNLRSTYECTCNVCVCACEVIKWWRLHCALFMFMFFFSQLCDGESMGAVWVPLGVPTSATARCSWHSDMHHWERQQCTE